MFSQLALCLFIVLVLLWVKDDARRKKNVLPLMFLIMTTFFAIRYDYGNDYWHYYERWASGRRVEGDGRGTGETFFYGFMGLFDYYYKYIIAQTIAFCVCMFYLVRKYVPPRYYFIFFWLFMTVSSQSYVLMSAQRSAMAACVVWIAFEFFYIQKKRWVPYFLMIGLASQFHTSALILLILPLFDFLLNLAKPQIIFALLIIGLVLGIFFTESMVGSLLSQFSILRDTYSGYMGTYRVGNTTFIGALAKSALLFPYYYICMNKDYFARDERLVRIWTIAMTIALFWSFGFDIDGRFSIYLFVFVIISFANVLQKLTSTEKYLCLVPLIAYWLLVDVYSAYTNNMRYQFTDANNGDGSFLFYHTIFSAPFLP